MFESIINGIATTFKAIPFSGPTWFVLAVLAFFVWLFARGSTDSTNPIKWEHLVIDSANDRASPFKLGYLIGLIVGTWIVVSFSDRDKLTYDIFGMYLTYLLGGASFNSFIKAKAEASSQSRVSFNESETEQTDGETVTRMSHRNKTTTVNVDASGKLLED